MPTPGENETSDKQIVSGNSVGGNVNLSQQPGKLPDPQVAKIISRKSHARSLSVDTFLARHGREKLSSEVGGRARELKEKITEQKNDGKYNDEKYNYGKGSDAGTYSAVDDTLILLEARENEKIRFGLAIAEIIVNEDLSNLNFLLGQIQEISPPLNYHWLQMWAVSYCSRTMASMSNKKAIPETPALSIREKDLVEKNKLLTEKIR